jgi:glycosyltransferase involved in cell wall biosynthesis
VPVRRGLIELANPSVVAAGTPEDNRDHRPKLRVLVVGQTPPPYHGQALMIQMMLNGTYKHARLRHVRMAFSRDISQVGRFSWRKVGHLIGVIVRIYWARLRHRVEVLYYPPAGPDLVPVLRDIVVLLSVRWLFRQTIFHFHAAGISTLLPRLPAPVRVLYRAAYFNANVAVRLSEYVTADGTNLTASRELIVPNAAEDAATSCAYKGLRDAGSPMILFVGALRESKGVRVLLNACALLQQSDLPFRLKLVGEFESREFDRAVHADLHRMGIATKVDITGLLTGPEKWRTYASADIFCFPSFVEALPLVLIEAMQFSLPIVASHCGGIPSLIEDGLNGFLVTPKDVTATAKRLAILVLDAELRLRMGTNGRLRYEQRYTPERFYQEFDGLFASLVL